MRRVEAEDRSGVSARAVPVVPARPVGPGQLNARAPVGLRDPVGLVAAALVPVALLATAMLWWPEYGDQSLFVLGAEALGRGSVYYRDFWDIKQPGLYWFYQLGDLLVAGGIGARLLEAALAVLAGWLVLSVTAGWGLRRSVRLAAPTLVLGPYLVWAFLDGVGQIEGLMNVLLLGAIRATWPGWRATTDRAGGLAVRRPMTPVAAWLAAGVIVGLVALLKTLYVPLVLIPLLAAWFVNGRVPLRPAAVRTAVAALGAAVPICLALVYLGQHSVLGLALSTTFDLPQQVAASPNLHLPGSQNELVRAVNNMLPITGPLALVGLIGARRRGTLVRDLGLVAVVVTALALAYPQLWTPYRFLMLAAPVGLLALPGLDTVLGRLAAARPAPRLLLRTAGSVLVFGLVAFGLRLPAQLVSSAGDLPWGLGTADRIARAQYGPNDRVVQLAAGMIAPGTQIYVVGDPSVIARLGAVQGLEVTGWSLEMLPRHVWDEVTRELVRSRPGFVYVDDTSFDWGQIRQEQGKAFFDYLESTYSTVSSTADGTWYRTADVGAPLPAADGNQLFAR